MTGEMSRADLTEDGEWGLFAHTARLLKCDIHPFDVYQGPYLLYRGHKLWFSNTQEGEWEHCIYDDTAEQIFPLPNNPYGYQTITAKELAAFIRKAVGDLIKSEERKGQ